MGGVLVYNTLNGKSTAFPPIHFPWTQNLLLCVTLQESAAAGSTSRPVFSGYRVLRGALQEGRDVDNRTVPPPTLRCGLTESRVEARVGRHKSRALVEHGAAFGKHIKQHVYGQINLEGMLWRLHYCYFFVPLVALSSLLLTPVSGR